MGFITMKQLKAEMVKQGENPSGNLERVWEFSSNIQHARQAAKQRGKRIYNTPSGFEHGLYCWRKYS